MIRVFFFIFFLIIVFNSCQPDKTVIEGKIIGIKDSWVKIRLWEFESLKHIVIDSVFVCNEKFDFTIPKVKGGLCFDFYFEVDKVSRFIFIEEGEHIEIKGNINNTKNQFGIDVIELEVSGGKSHSELVKQEIEIAKFEKSLPVIDSIIKTNKSSLLTPVFILVSIGNERYFDSLSTKVQNSYYGVQVASRIKKIQKSEIGKKVVDFNCKDQKGNHFTLSNNKCKYIILDFWASWCKPCRESHPELISLYNQYNLKGLEIVGISTDRNNTSAWLSAIEQDKIGKWKHILDGSCNIKSIADTNYVRFLPEKIIIDSNFIIIKRYKGHQEGYIKKFMDSLYQVN